jgi:hypothetical protein
MLYTSIIIIPTLLKSLSVPSSLLIFATSVAPVRRVPSDGQLTRSVKGFRKKFYGTATGQFCAAMAIETAAVNTPMV